ncbi:MAG: NAD(P)/FAD-dependent oxidoreductase [Hyphomonadaceae bacterium]|nr:NAD(P)/FAD-dependent oxidoreductase [Hyphomonadaceae bacterium]
MQSDAPFDCLIIGGGPAGLVAATYLSRFRRRTLVIDAGESRAAIIPKTRNVPGFPDGIGGAPLLDLMRTHAARYGAEIASSSVLEVTRRGSVFEVDTALRQISARTILIASGAKNIELAFPDHDRAVKQGLLRYCPICDAFEVIDQRIAIIGNSSRSAAEREFLFTYSKHVTLFAAGEDALEKMEADGAGVLDIARSVRIGDGAILIQTDTGEHRFDTIYSCLGMKPRSHVAKRVGVALDETGAVITDKHQRTNVPFVYAAGDVVSALDQIAVASGHAAIAATAIHNDLRKA